MGITVDTILLVIVIGFNVAYFVWIKRKLHDTDKILEMYQRATDGLPKLIDTYKNAATDLTEKLEQAQNDLRAIETKYKTEVERSKKAQRIMADLTNTIEKQKRTVRIAEKEYISMQDVIQAASSLRFMKPAEVLARMQQERMQKHARESKND